MKCLRWCPRYTEMVPLKVSPKSLWGNKPHHWNGGVYPEVRLGENQLNFPLYSHTFSTFRRHRPNNKRINNWRGYRYLCRFVGSGRTLDVMYIMWISGYAMVIWYFDVLFKVLFVLLSLSMYWRLFPWLDVGSDIVLKNLIMYDNIHFTEVWSNVLITDCHCYLCV